MNDPSVNVTDHAVLRYLERVDGIDIAAVRATIRARLARAIAAAASIGLGDDLVVVAPEAIYVIEGGLLITCRPAGHPLSARNRRRSIAVDDRDDAEPFETRPDVMLDLGRDGS